MQLVRSIALSGIVTVWAAWLCATPLVGQDGTSSTSRFLAALTYRAGSFICHQQTTRSFHVGGSPLPVCARCIGLYGGAAAGAWAAVAWMLASRRTRLPRISIPLSSVRLSLLVASLPTVITWAAEQLAHWPGTNAARSVSALPLGAAVAALVVLWAGGAAVDDTPRASEVH
ncbi:MAG: DUF2085 domain-containing protein [Acidobacteriota bacterium]